MADSATTTRTRTRGRSQAADLVAPGSEKFTKKHHLAASLLADDELTDAEIAAQVEITPRQLYNWKNRPEFAALVGDYVGKLQAGMLRLRIAKKRERVKTLDNLRTRLLTVADARGERYRGELDAAEDAAAATRRFFGDSVPPEAATGLLVRQETVNAQGMKTVNWSVDTGLVKTIMDLQKEAGQELGQRVDKSEIEHSGLVRSIVLEDD
jgi:hypothetical protein